MSFPSSIAALTSAAIALTLTACTMVGPGYQGPPDATGSAQNFTASTDPAEPSNDPWWQDLRDKHLDHLVSQALANNHDIAIAAQRLREARALRHRAASAILPQAGTTLSHSRLDLGDGQGGFIGGFKNSPLLPDPLEYWSSNIDVSWEIDIFGGTRRATRAASARAGAARESLHATRLAVAAETVEAYLTLAALREQLALVQRQVQLQSSQLDDVSERQKAGAASRLDVDRTRSRLEESRSRIPPLEAASTTQLRRLTLLLGTTHDALDHHPDTNRAALPKKLPMIRTGLPASLVTRRPDLRRAERQLAAATEDIGVATANFYPRFSLLGNPAANTTTFGDLFQAANYDWQFTPSVSWSIFSGGKNRATLAAADARQKQALLAYEKSVLAAIAEVDSQLANLAADTRRLATLQNARAATASAAKRVRETHDAGAADYLDVLVEEQRLRAAEITEIRAKAQLATVWVRLHKALGGGWQNTPPQKAR